MPVEIIRDKNSSSLELDVGDIVVTNEYYFLVVYNGWGSYQFLDIHDLDVLSDMCGDAISIRTDEKVKIGDVITDDEDKRSDYTIREIIKRDNVKITFAF